MCDLGGVLHDHGAGEDEYVLDTPFVREIVAGVRGCINGAAGPEEACAAASPLFDRLMRERAWLPPEFLEPSWDSGMGGGIGQWLIFRSGARDLCLFSLVVPPGAMTPIHDHLAWGLIGLYRGNQDEEIYRPGEGTIDLARRRPLEPGDFYALLPPRDDVHRVRTTSAEASVSIHLLANDTGCVLRHTYDEVTGEASPFRSGYVNAICEDTAA
jgi:predicted metal-dependent enzyme (double-stranded beta helix superfamily)